MLYEKLNQIHQKYQAFRNFSHIPDKDWTEKLVTNHISPTQVEFDQAKQQLVFKPFQLSLKKNKHDFLLDAATLDEAKAVYKLPNSRFYIDEQDRLIAEVDKVKMIAETSQDISIIREIFILGIYNFVYHQPVVVLDIGMNTGFASLYFAQRPNVVAVWGYEPFTSTYNQALENLKLNPKIADKIQPFDYGIDGEDKTITVEYDYNQKASIGVEGIDPNWKTSSTTKMKEEMILKSINGIIENVTATYPGVDIVAKIDCEGSEYAIFEALSTTGKLAQVKLIMMEWHRKGPAPLEKHLLDAGFVVFSRMPLSTNIGLIYAARP